MADNDIEIKVKVDGQGAITVLDALGNEIQKVEQISDGGKEGFSRMESGLITLNQALDLASKAFNAVSGAAKFAIDAIEKGSAIQDVEDTFNRLSKASGTLSETLLNDLQKATDGTIAKFDLMKQANEQLRAGLKPDEIIKLSEAARAFADEDGKSFEEEMNAITESILRGNDRFLKSKGIIIDNNKAYADFAATLGISVDKLNEAGKAEAIRKASLEGLSKVVQAHGKIETDAGDAIQQAQTAVKDAFNDTYKAIAGDAALLAALKDLATLLKTTLPGAIKATVESFSVLINVFRGTDEAFNKGSTAIKHWLDNYVSSGGILTSWSLAVKQTEIELGQQKKAVDASSTSLQDMAVWLSGVKEETKEVAAVVATAGTEGVSKYTNAIQKLNDVAVETPKILAVNRIAAKESAEAFKDVGSAVGSALSGIFSGDFSKSAVGNSLGGLGAYLGKEAFGTETFKNIFGDLGSFAGPLGSMLGDLLGSTLGKGIFSGISRIFGAGRDAQTDARKAADKYFADLFDANRLSVVIDGQLQQIKDLVFGNDSDIFETGAFDDAFHALEDSARGSFAGIGLAFEQLLNEGDLASGQLAAVLVNNIGGSLNNLQLLVEATGKSFEELQGVVVEAFLDGKISALEAQSALLGIQQIAEKGIPGALGATTEAFDNFVASGSKGGRAVIDALQDIGYEAKELGIKDFPALQANLVASGKYSADTIQRVFDALAAYGINSVEELTNKTAQDLIPVIAQLEATEFPFSQATKDASDLVTTLERLPASKDIEINLRVNASQSDRDLINKYSGSGQVGGGGDGLGPKV